MNQKKAKKLRKMLGYHPSMERTYDESPGKKVFLDPKTGGFIRRSTRTNTAGSPRAIYQASKSI